MRNSFSAFLGPSESRPQRSRTDVATVGVIPERSGRYRKVATFQATLRKQKVRGSIDLSQTESQQSGPYLESPKDGVLRRRTLVYIFVSRIKKARLSKQEAKQELLELYGENKLESLVIASSPHLGEVNPDEPYEDIRVEADFVDIHVYFRFKVCVAL